MVGVLEICSPRKNNKKFGASNDKLETTQNTGVQLNLFWSSRELGLLRAPCSPVLFMDGLTSVFLSVTSTELVQGIPECV